MSTNVEKQSHAGLEHEVTSSTEESGLQETWTAKEEARARWKVDTTVLPLLALGLLVFQLDRMNIASALTGGFAKDVNISQATVNLGNLMMFLAIVVFEIPCNMLLQKWGPRKWISGQVFVFGTVATLQVFIKNRSGFLASRWFLGFAESGYIPGAIYTLSTWYRKGELAKRVAILFFGMFSANALSPILASGILLLDGRQGLKGWQWTPSIYVSLGFNRTAANALAAVGASLALVVVFFFAWLSDRTKKRGAAVMAAQASYLVVLIVARSVQESVGTWSRWGLWTVVNAFAVGYHPVHNTWVQLNCKDARERSIAIAMWVMSAISGLMFGSQFFQASDLPFYRNGLRTMIAMVAVGLFFAIVQELVYWHHNRKVKTGTAKPFQGEEELRVYVL